jgi:hypothetical protein
MATYDCSDALTVSGRRSGMLTRPPFRGDAIDAHDVVLRFNQAPITNYSHAVGSKTTFRLTNKVSASLEQCASRGAPFPVSV